MRCLGRTADEKIGAIAGCQHGVVTRAQLLSAGLSKAGIERRLRRGTLLQEHRGVYRVGHRAPSVVALYLAAVFACGEGAALCGRAAAFMWGLLKGKAPPPEVTTSKERRVHGVRTRRVRAGLDGRDLTRFRGIPITTVARTLVDLAGDLPADELAVACHQAGVLYRTTPAELEPLLAAVPNRRGAGTLRRVMSGNVHVVLSRLEKKFLARLRAAALPLPITNRPAGGRRVDCRWPDRHLTVELDSYRYHHTRHAWEQDRRREREAYARGDDFRRYTWGDVFEQPGLMMAELRALLA